MKLEAPRAPIKNPTPVFLTTVIYMVHIVVHKMLSNANIYVTY